MPAIVDGQARGRRSALPNGAYPWAEPSAAWPKAMGRLARIALRPTTVAAM